MQYFKHCLNPKVIAGLVVVAVAIWILAPAAFAAALPVLVVAICPLSMLAMMLLMGDSGTDTEPGDPTAEQPEASTGNAQDAEIATLRAQVADLQVRLAAATHPTPDASAHR